MSVTGQNTRLTAILTVAYNRRQGGHKPGDGNILKAYMDACYCLDAPDAIAAGAHENLNGDDFGIDWPPMPMWVPRVPNVRIEPQP